MSPYETTTTPVTFPLSEKFHSPRFPEDGGRWFAQIILSSLPPYYWRSPRLLNITPWLVAPKPLFPPLIQALLRGDGETINQLIAMGQGIEESTIEGLTPLHYAAKMGWKSVVETLLHHGALPNVSTFITGIEVTPLHLATMGCHPTIVDLLLTKGALPNLPEEGVSPLHLAVENGDELCVRLLLAHQANLHQIDEAGRTALHMATANGHHTLISLLLQEGADRI